MPTTAPAEFIFVEKMPIMIAGNSELAASPKAKATVWAANPGGFMPSQVATTIAAAIDTRAARNSHFSLMSDRKRVVSGKSVSVRVDLGGRRIRTKTNK